MSLIHIINGFCGMLLRWSAVTCVMRLAFGVEYMATTRLFLVLSFILLLCPSDKTNGQISPNAGHEGVWWSECIAPDVHNFGTRWKRVVIPAFFYGAREVGGG